MKIKRTLIILSALFFAFFILALKGVSAKAAAPVMTLTRKETAGYVSQVGVQVDIDNSSTEGKILKVLCFSSGERVADYFDSCANTPMSMTFVKDEGVFVYHGEFMANLNGTYSVYARTWFDEITVGTIQINNIDTTGDTIVLTQEPVNDKLDNVIIKIEITGSESEVEEVRYNYGRRSLEQIANYGTILEDYSKLVVKKTGYYTFYVRDKAKNESVAYIKIVPSELVNGTKKVGINQANQIKYLVKEKEGIYYIELPKINNEISYPKSKVMVLSTYDDAKNQYNVLDKTQGYKQYIVIEGDKYSELRKDRVIIKVDPSVIGTYEEGNTYVYANFITKKQARSIGFNVTLRNFNYALLAIGAVAVLFIIFIISRLRVKRFSGN